VLLLIADGSILTLCQKKKRAENHEFKSFWTCSKRRGTISLVIRIYQRQNKNERFQSLKTNGVVPLLLHAHGPFFLLYVHLPLLLHLMISIHTRVWNKIKKQREAKLPDIMNRSSYEPHSASHCNNGLKREARADNYRDAYDRHN
jgi:hypothetical protein